MTEGKQDHLRCKVGLLRRVVTLCDKVRSCEIRNSLNVEPFLSAERSQLFCFGRVFRMSQEELARQVLLTTPTGLQPTGQQRTRRSDNISDLAWSSLDVKLEELSDIYVDLEVSRFLPPRIFQ